MSSFFSMERRTIFRLSVKKKGKGLITITSGTGKTIQVFELNSMEGQIDWDAREVPSGVYYYRLESSGLIKTGKIVVE